jgi:NTE family protein
MNDFSNAPKTALILSGGGARAAYQVGVLKAIAHMLPARAANPFPIICGTSAGAINSAALAAYAQNFRRGVRRLVAIWDNFRVDQVFRADARGVVASGARWLAAMMFAGIGRFNPASLFDRAPLRELLARHLPLEGIQAAIDAGALRALSVTASGYTSGESISFFQGAPALAGWRRARRVGVAAELTVDHLMASSAIPFLFAAERINREFFGDGSMRQIAPISPALQLGAERILVVGVRQSGSTPRIREDDGAYPPLARIAGHVLNTIFLDTLEVDLERLEHINRIIGLIPSQQLREHGTTLRRVDALMISPSQDLGLLAGKHQHRLPRPVRWLLRGVGALREQGSDLVSYLLFEQAYCRELIELGFADTLARRDEILAFLGYASPAAASQRA